MESRLARPSGQCAFSRGSKGKSREVGAKGCRALHVWLGGRGDGYDGRSEATAASSSLHPRPPRSSGQRVGQRAAGRTILPRRSAWHHMRPSAQTSLAGRRSLLVAPVPLRPAVAPAPPSRPGSCYEAGDRSGGQAPCPSSDGFSRRRWSTIVDALWPVPMLIDRLGSVGGTFERGDTTTDRWAGRASAAAAASANHLSPTLTKPMAQTP